MSHKINKKNLVALVRDESHRIRRINSHTNKFRSERNLSYNDTPIFLRDGWLSERVMQDIPLYISAEKVIERSNTDDYRFLPKHLIETLGAGMLRTSGEIETDYSILMSVTEHNGDAPPEGRTGVLLYKGEPVISEIHDKEFIIEIKGVGCPDGNNTRKKEMSRSGYFGQSTKRYGSATKSEGKRELENLELQREKKSITFLSGEGVRAAGLMVYKNEVEYGRCSEDRQDQTYLLRLAPSSVRSSFNHNPAFPKVKKRNVTLATTLGEHYAELAQLEGTLLHSTIHPENILFTGTRYVLTDFADCRRIDQIEDPHDFLRQVLDKISEVPGLSKRGVNKFYETIAKNLDVEWDIKTGYGGFIKAIWSGFFAKKTFEARKKVNIAYDETAHNLEEYCKTAKEYKKEIQKKIPEHISEYEFSIRNAWTRMNNLKERMTELNAVGSDGEMAKTMYPAHFHFSSGKDALDYIQMELSQKMGWLKKLEEESSTAKERIKGLTTAGDDLFLALKADPSLGSFELRGCVQEAITYLKNEVNVLNDVDTPEAKENLVVAKEKLELAESMEKDTYTLLQRLKEKPDYIRRMIDLPYNAYTNK